jgi:uncharacterized membrane protein (UPF0127 family)
VIPRRALAATALLVAVACGASGNGSPNASFCASLPWNATFGRHDTLQVEVADTDAERQQGLMGVTRLPENHGMAFVWDTPTDSTFWMKDTLIPLSIAFIDAGGKVVTLLDMTPCTADPCQQYAATAPYVTAIEANAGWFEEHHVETGDDVGLAPQMCS